MTDLPTDGNGTDSMGTVSKGTASASSAGNGPAGNGPADTGTDGTGTVSQRTIRKGTVSTSSAVSGPDTGVGAGPGTAHPQGTLGGFAKGFGLTFNTMFKKVFTQQYPFDVYPTAPRYHGRHVLNRHPDGLEKCIGCELCAWACPADAIYVEGGDNTEEERYSPGERYGKVYQINYLRCIFCGLCIEACPTRSLTMSNEYELALDNRQDLIYTKEQLMAPLLPGMEAPPHAMRLGDTDAYYVARQRDPDAEVQSEANAAATGARGLAHEIGGRGR